MLSLPLIKATLDFKPQSLVPLGAAGTVYPTLTVRDTWGTLTVKNGGALVRKQPHQVTVSASAFNQTSLQGPGFSLKLEPGWNIQTGSRKGDLVLKQITNAVP